MTHFNISGQNAKVSGVFIVQPPGPLRRLWRWLLRRPKPQPGTLWSTATFPEGVTVKNGDELRITYKIKDCPDVDKAVEAYLALSKPRGVAEFHRRTNTSRL